MRCGLQIDHSLPDKDDEPFRCSVHVRNQDDGRREGQGRGDDSDYETAPELAERESNRDHAESRAGIQTHPDQPCDANIECQVYALLWNRVISLAGRAKKL